MKFIKGLLGFLVFLVVTFFVVGMFLPTEQHVERSTVIDAEQGEVFALINDFQQFNRWSPWAAKDPQTQYEYVGPATGVGSKMIWRSENPSVGNGQQEIIESQPESMVRTKLTFDGFAEPSFATFRLQPADGGTRVTWAFDANLDSYVGRYMGLMMEKWVGTDYENGLARMKEVAEAGT